MPRRDVRHFHCRQPYADASYCRLIFAAISFALTLDID
jgi:hypothetical protein